MLSRTVHGICSKYGFPAGRKKRTFFRWDSTQRLGEEIVLCAIHSVRSPARPRCGCYKRARRLSTILIGGSFLVAPAKNARDGKRSAAACRSTEVLGREASQHTRSLQYPRKSDTLCGSCLAWFVADLRPVDAEELYLLSCAWRQWLTDGRADGFVLTPKIRTHSRSLPGLPSRA